MSVFDFPSVITPNSSSIQMINNVGSFPPSVFSGFVQAFGRHAARWGLTLTFTNLKYDESQLITAFFAHLHGMEHRFNCPDHRYIQRGLMTGTPLINGAGQTNGWALSTDGWTPDITLLAGNKFSFVNADGNHELKMLTTDAVVDGSGNADLDIFPDIHSAPADNAVITIEKPLGKFMLTSNSLDLDNQPGDWTSFNISAIEDIN